MDTLDKLLDFFKILSSAPFAVLFVIFLVKYIKRGNQITELEKLIKERAPELYRELHPYEDLRNEVESYLQRTSSPEPVQQPVQRPVQQPVQQTVPQPVQQPVQRPVQQPVQQPVVKSPVAASAPAPVSVAAPAPAPVVTPVAAPAPVSAPAPVAVPVPSPVSAPATVVNRPAQAPVVNTEVKPKREKFFSSINITFGIGVLLLTMVGATFMTGSWSWMSDAVRVIGLIAIVVMIYGMALFAGKGLKLEQTGFAMYSLASLLGPIVVVGIGIYELFGSGFSFKQGSGWLVATVASAVLLATSVLGRFIFKDKVKSNIYRTTTYVALTWLVIFLSAQIGDASDANVWGMICLGLATLALMLRIVALTPVVKGDTFYKVYSEIITYIPAVLVLFSIGIPDGTIFATTIVVFATLVLHAKFTANRGFVKYITPAAGMLIAISWNVLELSDSTVVMAIVTMAIIFGLYVFHKIMGMANGVSELGLPLSLCVVTSFIAFAVSPLLAAVSFFVTLAIFLFQLLVEPLFSKKENVREGVFKGAVSLGMTITLSILTAIIYYIGMSLLYFEFEEFPFQGHLYFTLAALVPAIAAVVIRFFKEDVRIFIAGMIMLVIAPISALISCFSLSYGTAMYYRDDVCAGLTTLSVMVMCIFFMLKSFKEKSFNYGTAFWSTVFINSPALAVYVLVEYMEGYQILEQFDTVLTYTLIRQIVPVFFLVLNIAFLAVAFIVKRGKEGFAKDLASGIHFFLISMACIWFLFSWSMIGTNWQLAVIAVIFAVLLAVFKAEFFSILPMLAAEASIIAEIGNIENTDIRNIVAAAACIAVAGLGRLIFRKYIFSTKAIDYLSLTSVILLFGLAEADYVPMLVCIVLAILILNLAGRVKIPLRVIFSIDAALLCLAVLVQPFIELPSLFVLEIYLVLILGTLLLICKVIKPFPENAAKYIWFTGVAIALVAEGISAAHTGEALDLIIVGTASIGIFIFAFIRRTRLWFILGIVAMISIAIYLSLEFWSTLVWLVYLLVSGSILIVMASINEWGKRHNKDGKKKRFFEEWKW